MQPRHSALGYSYAGCELVNDAIGKKAPLTSQTLQFCIFILLIAQQRTWYFHSNEISVFITFF